jgi:hypothetical protein
VPRFFFDGNDAESLGPDDRGLEFDSFEEAKAAALDALPSIAADMVDGKPLELALRLRDQDGHMIVTVRLALTVETHRDP